MTDSLKEIVARAEKAIVEGVNRPGMLAQIPVGDLRAIITSWRRRGAWIKERMEEGQ